MGTAILIGGTKGGTGKSTGATNLAIMKTLAGHDCVLVDTDVKQYSSSNMIQRRNELGIKPSPPCIQLHGNTHHEIRDLCNRYNLLIIDAGGRDSVELRSALSSPFVKNMYSPLQPSEFDLQTIDSLDELIMLSQGFNPELKCHIFFNQCPTHHKINVLDDAKSFVEGFENLEISTSYLSHRIVYQHAASAGLSVIEYEYKRISTMPSYQAKSYQPKASIELMKLYEDIFGEPFCHPLREKFPFTSEAEAV